MRRTAGIVGLLLLLASCSGVESIVDDVSGSPSGPARNGSQKPGGSGTDGESSNAPGGGGPGAQEPRYDDAGGLGSMVRTYLRSSPARRLAVEVDYVAGRAPSARALSHLAEVLEEVADKPGGIDVSAGNEIAGERDRWTVGEIKALEKRHRSARSSGDVAAMWIVYLDGDYADAGSALGVAYSASAAAIFRDRIDDATTALVNSSAIERSVLVHEVGHLLALVNIGYRSAIDHEDPEHPHHSKNKDSVMYYAVEDVSIATLLGGGPPSTFDEADKADLAMLKRG